MKRIITVILLSALQGQGLDGRYHSVDEIYSYLDSLNQIEEISDWFHLEDQWKKTLDLHWTSWSFI